MGGVGHELALVIERVLQAVQHVVEPVGQPPDLVGGSLRVDAVIELTRVDPVGRVGNHPDRAPDPACDEVGCGDRCQQRQHADE